MSTETPDLRCPCGGLILPESAGLNLAVHHRCINCGRWFSAAQIAKLRKGKDGPREGNVDQNILVRDEKEGSTMEGGLKECIHCKKEKARTEFYANNSCKDGLDPTCKECRRTGKGKKVQVTVPKTAAAKVCNRCEEEKSLDDFPKNPSCLDGHENICKQCRAERNAHKNLTDGNGREKKVNQRKMNKRRSKVLTNLAKPIMVDRTVLQAEVTPEILFKSIRKSVALEILDDIGRAIRERYT